MLQSTEIGFIAENRVTEAAEKFPKLPLYLEKHFIGKLQSRKIPQIVELFDVIQSVENLKQAKKISAECVKQNKNMQVFLQVNITSQENRSGTTPEEVPHLIPQIAALPNLQLAGVMGMASPLAETTEETVASQFQLLKFLQNGLQECSMGMSDDWQIAMAEGSTMVRLGRMLFEDNLDSIDQ